MKGVIMTTAKNTNRNTVSQWNEDIHHKTVGWRLDSTKSADFSLKAHETRFS